MIFPKIEVEVWSMCRKCKRNSGVALFLTKDELTFECQIEHESGKLCGDFPDKIIEDRRGGVKEEPDTLSRVQLCVPWF